MLYFDKGTFRDVLKKLGVGRGDNLFVHSYCASLGKVADIKDVIAAILEAVGYEGIVAMPAYSYDNWTAKRYFNPGTTRAETGVLPNAFLFYEGVYRTIQGNHSVAVWGDSRMSIIRDWVKSSFSKDSTIYQTVVRNFKNVMIGTSFSTGCSIFHCVEEEVRVPYRFWKSFPGVVQINEEKREFDFPMFVRDLAYTVDLRRAEPFLEKASYVQSVAYNYGKITAFPLAEAYDTVKREVEKNPMLLVSEVKST